MIHERNLSTKLELASESAVNWFPGSKMILYPEKFKGTVINTNKKFFQQGLLW